MALPVKKKKPTRKSTLRKQDDESAGQTDFSQQIEAQNAVGNVTVETGAEFKLTQTVKYTQLSEDEQERRKQKTQLKALHEAIEQKLNDLKHLVKTPLPINGNPYLFLEAFGIRDHRRFFGHTESLAEVLDHLTHNQTTFLDGIGRTSVLQAGVIPSLLRQGHLPILVSASTQPLGTSIKKQLLPSIASMAFLDGMSLTEFVRRVTDELQKQDHKAQLYLLVDRFEGLTEDARRAFRQEWDLCVSGAPDVHWLFSVPSDARRSLNIFKEKVAVNKNLVTLHPLERGEARETMLKQAALGKLQIDAEVVESILDKLDKPGVDPLQLQVVCYMLAGGKGPRVTHWDMDYYNRLKGADGILREYLERTIGELAEEEQEPAWQLLALLADPSAMIVSETDLLQKMRGYEIPEEVIRQTLKDLQDSHLVEYTTAYRLSNNSLIESIRDWRDKRAALKQAKEEFRQQLLSIGRSGLRGLAGGAAGFTLAYWSLPYTERVPITNIAEFFHFYFFNLTLRTQLGAFTGFVMILAIDFILASLKSERKWLRFPSAMLAGAISFGLALLFHVMLRYTGSEMIVALARAFLEGAVWGAVAGAGAIWIMRSTRQTWLKVLGVSAACGLALAASDVILNGLDVRAPFYIVFISGMIMPLCLIGFALISKSKALKGWRE